jgi:DNA polymerase-1
MVYGATVETLMETAKTRDRAKAEELLYTWSRAYPDAFAWIGHQQQQALRDGYVTTLYGRRIPLPVGQEKPDKLKRKAVNYPVQASAAEVVKRAMIKVAESGLLEPMRLQVHDELLFDGAVVEQIDKLDLAHISVFETPYEIKTVERWE